MILILRRNHFFRSFWAIEGVNELNEKDVKYFDLDSLDGDTFIEWMSDHESTVIDFESYKVDVSYWNTYSIGIASGVSCFGILLDLYIADASTHGIKNFRTDNMRTGHFLSVTERANPIHFNNDWKTAHLTEMWIDANPHWNFYNV
jgi:hypothetical protein